MSRVKIIFLFSFLFAIVVSGQNKQLIYGFDEVPQNLLLNPGGVPQGRAYIGVPGLSGLHLNAGSSGFSLYDVAASDG